MLAGFTSQRLPAFFKISGDGRVLLTGGIAIRMNCTSGATLVVPDAFGQLPIAADGRLHTSYTPPATVRNGVTYHSSDTLTAGLASNHSNLNGTWRLRLRLSAANGQSMTCDSGPVRFTATG